MNRRRGDTIGTDRDTAGDMVRSHRNVMSRPAPAKQNRTKDQSSRKGFHSANTDAALALSVQ
jgi:hypothetical protein